MHAAGVDVPEGTEKVIAHNLKYSCLTSVCLGILTAATSVIRAESLEDVGKLTGIVFGILMAVFFVEFFIMVNNNREYWLAGLKASKSKTVGQLIGVAIGSSLAACFCYLALTFVGPYFLHSSDMSGLATHLRAEVFTIGNLLLLAFIASSGSLVALGWIGWRQAASEDGN